jgi:hypothetical protein
MRKIDYRWLSLLGVGLALAIGVTLFSPFASGNPDGLERVAEDNGFIDEAEASSYDILPDYTIPGVADESASTILAGIVGVLMLTGVGLLIGYGPRLWRRDGSESGERLTSPGASSGADS